MTSGHQLRFPRLAGDWAGAGIVFATPRVGVAVRVVSELGKHPGTKNGCQAGLAEVDLSVRVLTKMGLDLLLQGLDLRVQGDQDRYLGTYGRRIGGSDQLRQAQLRTAQCVLDRLRLRCYLAAAGMLQRGSDLGDGQPGPRRRIG